MRFVLFIFLLLIGYIADISCQSDKGCIIPLCPLENGTIDKSYPHFPEVFFISSPDSTVRSGMEGYVLKIKKHPVKGTYWLYIKSHGKILTVYGDLKSINIREGKIIKKGQMIGTAISNTSGYSISFQILVEKGESLNGNLCINCLFQ